MTETAQLLNLASIIINIISSIDFHLTLYDYFVIFFNICTWKNKFSRTPQTRALVNPILEVY